MITEQELLRILEKQLDVGEPTYNPSGITTGIVVDTDDPLQNGRLRVYCANLNDDPKKLHHLPWAVYMSPYGGVISNNSFTRGAGKGTQTSDGPNAYGFWGIPEQGATVLVTCIDGDERRRVWMGCLQPHQETHTLFHGRYEWKDDGSVDGPFTSTKSPIQPNYENAEKSFNGERDSPEWKTRQAEYQAAAIPIDGPIPAEGLEAYLDQQYPEMSQSEKDEWVKEIVGAHGYDWSGNKALGSFLASRVFGFSTPGFHAFTMDDRPYNNRIRLRSSTGHQILLDDTNERIYIATNEGKSWVEMDSNGNIDAYSERRINMRAKEDINFSTDGSFRVKANRGIYMYAGDMTGQPALVDEKPEDGEIRFHSTGDMHVFVEKNLRTLVYQNKLDEITQNICQTVGGDIFIQVDGDMNTILNDGDYAISVNGDYNHHASGDNSIFAGNDNKIQAVNDMELFAYTGKMDVGSQLDMSIKSYEGDVSADAIAGNMKISSSSGVNQITMTDQFTNIFSTSQIITQSTQEIANQVYSGFGVDSQGRPTIDGNPIGSGCIRLDAGVNVSFKPVNIEIDAVEDVAFKVQKGFDVANKTIGGINDDLNQIQERVNDFMFVTQISLQTFLDNWLASLPGGFTIPALPSFPTVPSFSLASIELPDFDFDFCITVGDFLNVEDFNPVPDGLFGTININLGNWSKDTFKNWFNRNKDKLEDSVNNLQTADTQADASLDNAIDDIKLSVEQIRDALNNLVELNIFNNAGQVASYTLGIEGLNNALDYYNAACDLYNQNMGSVVVDRLTLLHNEANDHMRSVVDINSQIQADPISVQGFDYSELEEMSVFFNQFYDDISQIGGT